jgi:hypothetical protein
MPPFRSRLMLAWAPAWDKYGSRLLRFLAGAIVIEASKQVYAAHAVPARAQRRRVLPVPSLARPATPRAAARRAPSE